MRPSASAEKLLTNQKNGEKKDSQSEHLTKKCRYFEDYSGGTSPFDVQTDIDEKEDVFAGIGVKFDIQCIPLFLQP